MSNKVFIKRQNKIGNILKYMCILELFGAMFLYSFKQGMTKLKVIFFSRGGGGYGLRVLMLRDE